MREGEAAGGGSTPTAPDELAAHEPEDDEGESYLFGDDDSEADYQRSHPAMSEDEESPDRGERAAGSGLGPAEHAGEGGRLTGSAADSGLG